MFFSLCHISTGRGFAVKQDRPIVDVLLGLEALLKAGDPFGCFSMEAG
jgi:hypothetical protein